MSTRRARGAPEDPVRVARPADDRRLRRRGEGLPRRARARDSRREPARRDLPRRARAGRRRDRGGTGRARVARLRARASPSCSPRATKVAVVIDNQFRPTPQSRLLPAVFDAIEAAGQAGGGRLRERQGLPDVGVRHRAEDRPGQPRPHGAPRDRVPPERPAERRDVHVRRRLVARHAGVAAQGGRRVRPEDHDRPGAVEPLGRGRRRQADPARASSPTRRSSRTTARSSPRRRRTTAPTRARCARTSTRSRRCAASSAR